MRIRVGLAAIIGMLCLMIGVIAGGRAGDSEGGGELAAGELAVAGEEAHDHGDGGHTHGDGEDHDHADGDHAHGDGEDHDHADGDHAHADGDHGDGHAHAAGTGASHAHASDDPSHGHPDGAGHANHPAGGDHPDHPPGVDHPDHPPGVDHPDHPQQPAISYTAEQLDLLRRTQEWISPRYADVNAAKAAGYTSIGDAATGHEHYVHNGYLNDPTVLEPTEIESLVYEVGPGGQRTLVSGMYILPIGQTMAHVPPAYTTPQTPWHIHSNLCWALNPIRVVGLTNSGQAGCPPGSIYFVTPPMLHVWLFETPCGWFADLESFSGDCNAHPH